MIETKEKIEDIKEFEKLFKISIPVKEEMDYYLQKLSESPEFYSIDLTISNFIKLEQDVKELGYKSVASYKLDYALPKLKEYIINTKAYKELQGFDYSKKFFRKKDLIKKNEDKLMLSIDFSAANFNTVKLFDEKFHSELNGTWEELCEHLDIHPVLALSKSYRQLVFGNTNPKRLGKIQHMKIMKLIEFLVEDEMWVKEDDIVFISNDELVILVEEPFFTSIGTVGKIIHYLDKLSNGVGMPLHTTIFKLHKIGKDMFLKTVYSYMENAKVGGSSFGGPQVHGFLSEWYKTLFGVPKHKYYKYFKSHILEEEVEERDLYFWNDGELAIWNQNEDSIDSTHVPEGEITLEEVEREYPNFLKRLKDEVPGLNDAQRRKIINLATSLCRSCMDADNNCCCHKDE